MDTESKKIEFYGDGTEKVGETKDVTDLPRSMKFFMEKGRAMVQFNLPNDKRKFHLDSPVIRAELETILRKAKKDAAIAKKYLPDYMRRARRAALMSHRQPGGGEEDALERQPVVLGCVMLMMLHHKAKKGPFKGTLTGLRMQLEKVCEANDVDTFEWPKKHHFSDYLKAHTGDLAENGLRLKFGKRSGPVRPVTLEWADESKIPKWQVKVTQSDTKKGSVASQEEWQDVDEAVEQQFAEHEAKKKKVGAQPKLKVVTERTEELEAPNQAQQEEIKAIQEKLEDATVKTAARDQEAMETNEHS